MARISSYDQDGTLNKLDKVIGTDSITGDTKNYTINSMLQLVNQEGLVEAFDGASFAFVDYIAPADNPRGVINLNASVASPANFSDINEIYISTVDKTGLSIVEYLDNSLNNQIKISLKGNMNQFGIYEVTAIVDHDGGAYKRLTLTPRAHNGILTVQDDFFLSNYSAVFDQDFSNNNVTEFGDVHHAGSGRIITNVERTSLTNFTNNGLVHGDVVDNVSSTATDVPLSANQGKILKDLINNINTLLTSDNVDLDTLQEVVDFIEANRESLNSLAISNIAGLQSALNAKQNAEAGKGLSANDFTDILLNKLNNISANAEVNVNADWTATSGDAEILNKPTDVTDLSQHSVTELNNVTSVGSGAIITGAERTKLTDINVNITNRTVTDGTTSIVVPPANAEQNVNADWDATSGDAQILNKPALAPANAEQNVQSDWNVTDSSSDAFILNKPTLAPSDAEQNVQVDWNETDANSDTFILNKPALAPSNAEQNVQVNWNETATDSDAFILNKPALAPSNAEQNVQADWDETDSAEDSFINNKPDVSITKAKIDTALGTDAADDSYFYKGDGTWADPAADISLGDLSDVRGDTTDPGINSGFVLRWVPATNQWYGASLSLEHLYNVSSNQSNSIGKVLAVTGFNAQSSVNQYDAVTLNINDLGDFDINTPEDKQILQYNNASSHWENVTNLQLPGTLEFTTTESTEPSFDNGIYVSTEDGHDVMHFRYHGHDLSIDYLTQVLPTGILNGGVLSKANSTQFTIAAGDGVINDLNKGANTDPHPEIIKVSWAEQTITVSNLDTNDTAQLNSWIYVDSSGTVQQQSTAFTDAQKKSNIIIGSAIHSEGVLKFVKTFPHTGYNNASQMNEFAGIFGPLKKSGHRITANGANLSIDRAAGVSFALGRNYANDPENPSTVSDAAKTQCVIHRYYSDGNDGFVLDDGTSGGGYTTLDPGNYDDGSGTLGSVAGGHYTVQRLYYFPGTPDIIVSYYGRDEYNSIDIAEKSYNLENFVEAPNTSDQAIYVGAIIMSGGATDLTSTSDAKFLTAGAFRGLAAVTVGGAIAGSSLNDLSDVNIQNLSDAEVLRYSSSTQQWENVSDSILPITLDTANNRVGINQTAPTHSLHVVGEANITGNTILGGTLSVTGNVTGNNLNISDWDTAYGWGDHSAAGYLTAHPSVSAATSSSNSGRTYIQSLTLDSNGHVSSIATATETVVNTDTIDMGDGFKIQNSSGSDQFTIQENDGLRIAGSGATSISFDSATKEVTISSSATDLSPITLDATNSRVGINTTSPEAALDVHSASSYPMQVHRTGGANQNVTIKYSDGNTDWWAGKGGNNNFSIGSHADVGAYGHLQITTGGNVGIGTASPAHKLHVAGTGYYSGQLTVDGFTNNYGLSFREGYSPTNVGVRAKAIGSANRDGLELLGYNGIDFTVNNGSDVAMHIGGVDGDTGNVGIGTTSPGDKLEVDGNIKATGARHISSEYDSNHYMRIESHSGGGVLKGTDGGVVTTFIRSYGDSYLNGGKFGIGTASPATSLDIDATDAVIVPKGTTAQRPSTGEAGMFRYNTEDDQFEGYTTEWGAIAGSGSGGASNITRTSFSGDDSTTQFSLSENIADEANTQIYIGGVYQEKTTYSVSGQQITFSEAPPEGTNNIEVIHIASVTIDGASGITRNTYTGTGSQQSFTLSVTPSNEDFTFVYVDGVYADKNEYTLNNNVITFVSSPANSASVEVMTINAVNVQQTSYLANDTFIGDDSTTTFALVNGQPSNEVFTMVFVQGVYQNKNTYSLSSNSIVFTEAPYTGDSIEVLSINGGGVKTLPPTTVDDIRYNVEVINTDATAQAGYVYVFTGNLTLTLPALPKVGQSIKISNRSSVATCVLGAGGNKIMGSTENLTLDTATASFELIYSGNDEGWVIIGQ